MRSVVNEDCYSPPLAEDEPTKENSIDNHDFVISASFLIGLGVGLLVDHVVSCLLVGLGFGFLASELLLFLRRSREGKFLQSGGTNVTNIFIGTILFFFGVSIVWAPTIIWPYAVA